MTGIVIIGAGHGGVQLAASLREEGFAGDIRIVSGDPDLPYHKPPLSKTFMESHETPLQALRAESFFKQKSIQLELDCRVTVIVRDEKQVQCDDGRIFDYDTLVLATGADARHLNLPGEDLNGIYSIRTATNARALRNALPDVRRVVVIGGGFIGLEAAAMLTARGVSVDVVELAPRLLGRATSEAIAEQVTASLRDGGVTLHLGQSIQAFEGLAGDVAGVQVSGTVLPADIVLVGVGAVPNDQLAKAAGLEVDNGIVVDTVLRTEDPDIYALGDCAAFPQVHLQRQTRLESVQNATDQARSLAKTQTGTPTPYTALPWFWSDIAPLKLQIAGLTEGADQFLETRFEDGTLKSVYALKAGRLVACETLNSPGEHMLSRRMIAEGLTPDLSVLRSGNPAEIKTAYLALTH